MFYGDATGFEAYNEARGRTIPGTWDTAFIQAALLVASEWIDNMYGPSFIGYKTGGFTQEQEWPRTNAVVTISEPYYNIPTNQIPDRVVKAAYEAAFRQGTTPGSLQTDYTPGKYKSVEVTGAIKVDYATFNSAAETQVQIGVIDNLLLPLLNGNSAALMSGLSGAASRV